MRIGLITIYSVPNYGSVLQAYATQKVFELNGHECVIIRYDYYWDQMRKNRRTALFKSIILNYIPRHKTSKLRQFRNKYFNFTKPFKTIGDLETTDWSSFDVFVVGSDQVWNTRYLKGNSSFLLSFVPDDKPKYSLSSSFAMKQLPEQYIPLFKKELSKFSALSVREENGVKIIRNDLNIKKDVRVTLDPTLLLDKDQWLRLGKKVNINKKSYILVYLWTYAFDPRPFFERVVEHFQRKTEFEIRVLEGHRHLKDLQVPFIDNNHSSIQEFINLFANASLVITSSFHGTAFAVNFGIPLISIVPAGNSDDRQTTLLKKLCLDNCIVREGDNISLIDPSYNNEIEQERLSKLRKEDLKWINNMICKNYDKII